VAVVAIGDVHGDYRNFYGLLQSLELVNAEGSWSGGTSHLVQTGDLFDRGPDSGRVVRLLMRLEREAREAGGRVTVLLGNHEAMNLTGDLRYVADGEFAAFADAESAEFRNQSRAKILSLLQQDHRPLLRSNYYAKLARTIRADNFDTAFPHGYFAHRRALSSQGDFGRWLLGHDVVHVENGVLFVHAGISPRFAALGPAQINRDLRSALKNYLESVAQLEKLGVFEPSLGSPVLSRLIESERRAGGPAPSLDPVFRRLEAVFAGPLFANDGPLWYRGLAQNDESRFASEVKRILKLQQVHRIVVGHTQHPSLSIQGRFRDQVMLIDTGMNREFYGGRPSALLIHKGGEASIFEANVQR